MSGLIAKFEFCIVTVKVLNNIYNLASQIG